MKTIKTKNVNNSGGAAGNSAPTTAPARSASSSAAAPRSATSQEPSTTSSTSTPRADSYNGIAYAAIVRAWLAQRGIAGDVAEGARNTTLYQLARDLRYIMDFDAERMLTLLPDWGLGEAERRTAIGSAVSSPRGTEIPQGVQDLLTQCQKAANEDEDATPANDANPLPAKLPPLLDKVVKLHPQFPKAAVLAALPALGTLLSNLRSRYVDGETHSPIFFTVIQAPQASGKSFARRLSDWLMAPVKENDQKERRKEQEYKEKCKRAKNAKEQPEEPTVVVRCLPATVSNAVLLKRADKAQGLALYTFAEEIDTVARGNKAGAWSSKNDIFRMAFDGAEWGQDYMAENSYAAVVSLHYNLLFLGTPLAVGGFFRKVEDGMASRFMLAQLPDTRGEALHKYTRLTVPEQNAADRLIRQAYTEGCDPNPVTVTMPDVLNALDRWQMERIAEYNLDPDNFALDILRRRAAVMGFRAAMVAWWLCGRKQTKEVTDFALWVATEVLQQQLVAFGKEMNRIERQSMETLQENKRRARGGRNGRLLASLGDTFTKADVIVARKRMGREGEPSYVITRWLDAGLIERSPLEKQKYRKVEKTTPKSTGNEKL